MTNKLLITLIIYFATLIYFAQLNPIPNDSSSTSTSTSTTLVTKNNQSEITISEQSNHSSSCISPLSQQESIKNQSFISLDLLEGEWFDVARTNFIYKQNTWHHGKANFLLNKSHSFIELNYSGLNNSLCETMNSLINLNLNTNETSIATFVSETLNNNGSLFILNRFETFDTDGNETSLFLVAYCVRVVAATTGDEWRRQCASIDDLDLFLLSRKSLNNLNLTHHQIYELFDKHCVSERDNVVINDHMEMCTDRHQIVTMTTTEETSNHTEITDSTVDSTTDSTVDSTTDSKTTTSDELILIAQVKTTNNQSNFTLDSSAVVVQNDTILSTDLNVSNYSLSSNETVSLFQPKLILLQSDSEPTSNNDTFIAKETVLEKDSLVKQQLQSFTSTLSSSTTTTTATTTTTTSSGSINIDLVLLKTDQIIKSNNLTLNESTASTNNETLTSTDFNNSTVKNESTESFLDSMSITNNNNNNNTLNLTSEKNESESESESESMLIVSGRMIAKESVSVDENETLSQTNDSPSPSISLNSTDDSNQTTTSVIDIVLNKKKVDLKLNKEDEEEEDEKEVENNKSEEKMDELIKELIEKEQQQTTTNSTSTEIPSTTIAASEGEVEEEAESDENDEENVADDSISISTTTSTVSTTDVAAQSLTEEEVVVVETTTTTTLSNSSTLESENKTTLEIDSAEVLDNEAIIERTNERQEVVDEEISTTISSAVVESTTESEPEPEVEEISSSTEQTSTITTTEETTTEETTTSTTTTTTPYPCNELLNCSVSVCLYGRKLDENGCEMCDCLKKNGNESECAETFCTPCFYGSFTDEFGCDTCNCKPRPKPSSVYECPRLECDRCHYGSIKDEYGCETCLCIRPNSLERTYSCPPEPTCPYGTCKHGSVLNDFGCPTCDCLRASSSSSSSSEKRGDECVKQRCSPCAHGYFTDADGCETCLCKPDWMAPCAASASQQCAEKCEHGSYLDRNGCPSCECLPNPDLISNCGEMAQVNNYTQCNTDGTFKPKQCNEKECRCVTKDGIPISGFKSSLNESDYMNCECALALYDMSFFKAIGFKLFCSSNGNYETIQCVGSTCACVNDHGDPLGPSVPIYQKHLLRCEGVYQRVYYDQYLTTMAPTTLTPPLCVYHREKALDLSHIDPHLSIPECDERGLYEALQCDRPKKYCWCVNVHNGVELYGTRSSGKKPDCS